MMLFHRMFSKKINTSHRWSFWKSIGLSEEDFLFSEELPGQTLRVLYFEKGKAQAILKMPGLSNLAKITLRHSVLLPEPTAKVQSFTSWVLPFPWSLILSSFGQPGTEIEYSSESLQGQFEKLRRGFKDLEAALTQTEIACFQVGLENPSAIFLFHSVRGKILRAGIQSQFDPSEHEKDLNQTSYSNLAMPIDNPLNLKGLDRAVWQIQTAIKNKKSFKRPLPTSQSLLDDPLEL